jgi:hypothetical protein
VAGKFFTIRSTFARPADNTAYQAGDEVSNHATAGSVVRATFDLSGYTRGRILAASIDLEAASGNVVITAANFLLHIFKTPNAPAAVGDNVTHPISAATRALSVGHWRFDAARWVNSLGAMNATGTTVHQKTQAQAVQPSGTPVLQVAHVPGHPFDFTGQAIDARQLTAVLQVLDAWTPTGIVNTFGITLDIEAS